MADTRIPSLQDIVKSYENMAANQKVIVGMSGRPLEELKAEPKKEETKSTEYTDETGSTGFSKVISQFKRDILSTIFPTVYAAVEKYMFAYKMGKQEEEERNQAQYKKDMAITGTMFSSIDGILKDNNTLIRDELVLEEKSIQLLEKIAENIGRPAPSLLPHMSSTSQIIPKSSTLDTSRMKDITKLAVPLAAATLAAPKMGELIGGADDEEEPIETTENVPEGKQPIIGETSNAPIISGSMMGSSPSSRITPTTAELKKKDIRKDTIVEAKEIKFIADKFDIDVRTLNVNAEEFIDRSKAEGIPSDYAAMGGETPSGRGGGGTGKTGTGGSAGAGVSGGDTGGSRSDTTPSSGGTSTGGTMAPGGRGEGRPTQTPQGEYIPGYKTPQLPKGITQPTPESKPIPQAGITGAEGGAFKGFTPGAESGRQPYDEARTFRKEGFASPLTARKHSGGRLSSEQKGEMAQAIRKSAKELGVPPEDLASIISFETGGTLDPLKSGPYTKWGHHRGLIQWGEPQAKQYLDKYGGLDKATISQQMEGVTQYLKDRGVRPGMSLPELYGAVLSGSTHKLDIADKFGTTPRSGAANMSRTAHAGALAALERGQAAAPSTKVKPGEIPVGAPIGEDALAYKKEMKSTIPFTQPKEGIHLSPSTFEQTKEKFLKEVPPSLRNRNYLENAVPFMDVGEDENYGTGVQALKTFKDVKMDTSNFPTSTNIEDRRGEEPGFWNSVGMQKIKNIGKIDKFWAETFLPSLMHNKPKGRDMSEDVEAFMEKQKKLQLPHSFDYDPSMKFDPQTGDTWHREFAGMGNLEPNQQYEGIGKHGPDLLAESQKVNNMKLMSSPTPSASQHTTHHIGYPSHEKDSSSVSATPSAVGAQHDIGHHFPHLYGNGRTKPIRSDSDMGRNGLNQGNLVA